MVHDRDCFAFLMFIVLRHRCHAAIWKNRLDHFTMALFGLTRFLSKCCKKSMIEQNNYITNDLSKLIETILLYISSKAMRW